MTEDEKFDKARAELDEIMKHLLDEKRARVSDRKIIANATRNEILPQSDIWKKNQLQGIRNATKDPSWLGRRQKELNANFKGYSVGIDIVTGKIKYRLTGIKEMKAAGINPGMVSECINGKRKSHKGCTWHREEIKK